MSLRHGKFTQLDAVASSAALTYEKALLYAAGRPLIIPLSLVLESTYPQERQKPAQM